MTTDIEGILTIGKNEMDLKLVVLALLMMLVACGRSREAPASSNDPPTPPAAAADAAAAAAADAASVSAAAAPDASDEARAAAAVPKDSPTEKAAPKPLDPPPPPPPVTESAVDKYLEQLPRGSAVFTTPPQADQYKSFDVTLRLENRELAAMLNDAGKESPNDVSAGVAGIHMSDRMRAELIGVDFSPSGEETIQEQPSSVKEGTTWKWQLHSDVPGSHQLTARIETLMKIDGKDSWRTIDVAEVSIDIKINEIGWAVNNWKWIATVIVLPLIGWIAKRKFGEKSKEAP